MKILRLSSDSLEKIIGLSNLHLGGSVSKHDNEQILHFDNENGTGTLTAIKMDRGLSFLQYEACFSEDLKIVLQSGNNKPVYFMYCLEGKVLQNFGGDTNKTALDEFQTAILGGSDVDNEISFLKDRPTKISIIRISEDRELQNTSPIKQQMRSLFANGEEGTICYFGTYNLRIGEQIAQLGKINQDGVVKKLLIEGILNLTLAMEIQHLQADLIEEQNPTGSLTKYELGAIKEVSRKIEEHPEIQYSIKSICLECGLSASKLQEGFKLLHDKTVSDFIRNERLNTAERLISTTDMNISEIVYTVGLSSRSYFSKIFKRRYNCSPKTYQDSKKTAVSA